MYGVVKADIKNIRLYMISREGFILNSILLRYSDLMDDLEKTIKEYKVRYIGITSHPLDLLIWRENREVIDSIKGVDRIRVTYPARSRASKMPWFRGSNKYPWRLARLVSGYNFEVDREDEVYIGPPSTYLIYRLTGRYVIDPGSATTLGLYDFKKDKIIRYNNKIGIDNLVYPTLIDNVEYLGSIGDAEIAISISSEMADIIGFGCLRKGCTKVSGDEILHISMVVDKKASGKEVSGGVVLKIGEHIIRCLEAYLPESILLSRIDSSFYKETDIEKVIDTLKRLKDYMNEEEDISSEYLLDAIVFKLQRRFRELINISDYRPDLIYVSGKFNNFDPFLRKLADYTGYYIAASRGESYINGVYSLLRIYGGRGKFDDISEVEEGIRLIEPSLGERRRLEIINRILDGVGRD